MDVNEHKVKLLSERNACSLHADRDVDGCVSLFAEWEAESASGGQSIRSLLQLLQQRRHVLGPLLACTAL